MTSFRTIVVSLFLIFPAAGSLHAQSRLVTPLKASGFSKLTSNKEVTDFIRQCDAQSNLVSASFFPLQNGLEIPVVKITRPGNKNKRLRVLMIAQQHGNEPSGMEAMLSLISAFAANENHAILKHLELMIIPQCNPWGSDHHLRRNNKGIDLNRDHLLIRAEETAIIQSVFREFNPEMTVDFHEYYPYGIDWEEFGYRRNFDIQVGGLTNVNTSKEFRRLFKSLTLPDVKKHLNRHSFSFFEYTLGDFPAGERLRHSTVDINDGRQSPGITGTFSLIVEGMNGRDSLQNLERRSESQYQTAVALLQFAKKHRRQISKEVNRFRELNHQPTKKIAIIQEHFKGDEILDYPLWSIRTGTDTLFKVKAYHPEVKAIETVDPPLAYLIPVTDTMLMAWIRRSGFTYTDSVPAKGRFSGYRIKGTEKTNFEGYPGTLPLVEKVTVTNLKPEDYLLVPVRGIFSLKIVLALEPRAMHGLPTYPEFQYIILGENYPVLRMEKEAGKPRS
ncbi:MAG: DUF2817 domain-containing protein [Lentimicrobium sp.]|nr:DUF2817 domain-containing protein [Lentimicrobium sp.]